MPKGIKGFQKGKKNPIFGKHSYNFGKHPSKETRRKQKESHTGYVMPEETKKKISKKNKGHSNSKEHNEKIRKNHAKYWLGKKQSKKANDKRRRALIGKNKGSKSGLWRGGISFEPYGLEFNNDLREVIRNRDRRKCQVCQKIELNNKVRLSVHHIDYNKKNNNPNNLISLCKNCHMKTNSRREYWIKYFKNI